jgi:ATP-dependent DNA helicase RecG
MTATPIPRTLAMTLYGDLDYSVIDQLPPGRKPIATKHVFFNKKAQLFHFLKEEIAKGYQVYMVFPLIEESEKIDLKNLVDGYEEIQREFPEPQYKAGMLHGKMKNDEKNAQMALFVEGKTQLLVATTVIEVGVNVPNASVMVIVNAERFGLSQLHQLRGRVGRGSDQSFCFLLTDFNLNLDGRKRMQIMTDSSDGFVIAEADLKMRGPGDISGTRQSGDVQLKLASIAEDGEILSMAQRISQEIVQEDPQLHMDKYKNLKYVLDRIKKETKRWSKIS